MATQSATILNGFNDHFMDFVSDIINVFPVNFPIEFTKIGMQS